MSPEHWLHYRKEQQRSMDQFMPSTSIIGFPECVFSGKNGKVKRVTRSWLRKSTFFLASRKDPVISRYLFSHVFLACFTNCYSIVFCVLLSALNVFNAPRISNFICGTRHKSVPIITARSAGLYACNVTVSCKRIFTKFGIAKLRERYCSLCTKNIRLHWPSG